MHAHVTREAGGHEAPQPALKCGQSERLQYLDGQIGNFEYYVKRAQRAEGSGLCALVEPRYLVPLRRRKWLPPLRHPERRENGRRTCAAWGLVKLEKKDIYPRNSGHVAQAEVDLDGASNIIRECG